MKSSIEEISVRNLRLGAASALARDDAQIRLTETSVDLVVSLGGKLTY
jgi:hypothetical protein